MYRCLILAFTALAASSCGPPSAPKQYPKYDYGPPTFRDDAPTNYPIKPDQLALSFTDHKGNPVDLKSYRGKKTIVLVVTRGIPEAPGGVFCPHCVAQVAGLSASRAEFEKRDAAVLVVFPGPADRVGEFLRQTAGQGTDEFSFPLLLDKDVSVVRKLGLSGDLAKPSTFIIDKDGSVVYSFVGANSSDRPSVKAILKQLDGAKK